MSYLHPAYNRLLPATARPQLVAYLQLIERNVYASADRWTDIRQSAVARELGRTVRSVKRYERVCLDAGILIVEHHKASNRRRLTMRSAKEALSSNPTPRQTPIRQWGHACPHSGDTDVPTVEKSHLLPRARDLSEETSSDSQAAAPRNVPSAPPAGPSPAVARATAGLVELLGARWATKVAELVRDLVRAQGEPMTLGYLPIVVERSAREVRPYERAQAVLRLLNARLRKARETGGPRSGRARAPIPIRMGA